MNTDFMNFQTLIPILFISSNAFKVKQVVSKNMSMKA